MKTENFFSVALKFSELRISSAPTYTAKDRVEYIWF